MGCLSAKTKCKQEKPKREILRTIDTIPEDNPDIIRMASPDDFSSSLQSSPKCLLKDFKVYTLEFFENSTTLLSYSTMFKAVEKTDLEVNLFPEAGFLRLSSGDLLFAGGIDLARHVEVKNVFIINPFKSEIFEASEMLFVKRKLRLLQCDNFVYAIGGVKEFKVRLENYSKIVQDYSNSFLRYSLKKNEWEKLEDLPVGLELPGCFELNKKIYVTGGVYIENSLTVFDGIQIYDIQEKKWSTFELKLPLKLYGHLCAVIDNSTVLVFGGITDDDEANTVCWTLKYNTFHKYNSLPSMHETLFLYNCEIHNGEIFCFNEDNVLFMLNTNLSSWTASELNL